MIAGVRDLLSMREGDGEAQGSDTLAIRVQKSTATVHSVARPAARHPSRCRTGEGHGGTRAGGSVGLQDCPIVQFAASARPARGRYTCAVGQSAPGVGALRKMNSGLRTDDGRIEMQEIGSGRVAITRCSPPTSRSTAYRPRRRDPAQSGRLPPGARPPAPSPAAPPRRRGSSPRPRSGSYRERLRMG
jgi:hypothetical protein